MLFFLLSGCASPVCGMAATALAPGMHLSTRNADDYEGRELLLTAVAVQRVELVLP